MRLSESEKESTGLLSATVRSQHTADECNGYFYQSISNESTECHENLKGVWLRDSLEESLPEFNGVVEVPQEGSFCASMKAFMGPGALVAVGYMDPGNWSTDIAGGSQFGYKLLFVILLSSLIAMFLQALAVKAGLATKRDLAQICRDSYPTPVVILLWIIQEIAICATDVAEVLGSAIALKLLFGLPIFYGVLLTACDVLLVLFLNGSHFRHIEVFVSVLILIITVCFVVQMCVSKPEPRALFIGFLPSSELIVNKDMLFIGIGIIGATVMPHNLFLHSSVVLTRHVHRDETHIQSAIKYSIIDSTLSLTLAFFVNASILIVSASSFYRNGYHDVATLQDAYKLLDFILNSNIASVLFGIALLASGQNSTLTGTLTGQIIMEGFMTWKISPPLRRIITRLIAIVPAILAVGIGGENSANTLLIYSQVILSYALPFAVIPLVHVTSNKSRMKGHVNSTFTTILAIICSVTIIALNIIVLIL